MDRNILKFVVLILLSCTAMLTSAADKASGTDKAAVKVSADSKVKKPVRVIAPVYVPPRRGAPLARVGGGTRGTGDKQPFVAVITPEHAGLTSTAQPSLYWYVSEVVQARFEFALINDNEIDPIIEVVSDKQVNKGLNSLDLSDHGVKLVPGVAYQWSVALVSDAGRRSGDIVSSGQIEYVTLSDEQEAQRPIAAEAMAGFYAGQGYWYDTFAAMEDMITSNPGDATLKSQRAALLEQVGLNEVSAGIQ